MRLHFQQQCAHFPPICFVPTTNRRVATPHDSVRTSRQYCCGCFCAHFLPILLRLFRANNKQTYDTLLAVENSRVRKHGAAPGPKLGCEHQSLY
ncbi:hypothetical protein J6590_080243 [Homalodisca vitripennis]|nr:hypothetical protein J6590_105379 [Homalodisca vitripennis]KAG8329738.1 hypothetical protein J6590_080243 [Homalodisca vitripennis]